MRSTWVILAAVAALSACGDPLAGIDRVSEDGVLPDAAVATALPTDEELARENSVLSELFRDTPEGGGAQVAGETDEATSVDPAPTADPLETAETDTVVTKTAAASPTPPTKPQGLFGWLRNASVAQAHTESAGGAEDDTLVQNSTVDDDDGLGEDVRTAALTPEGDVPDVTPALVKPKKQRGLFARDTGDNTDGLALRDVTLGTLLPFGEVGRVCGARPGDLGTLIEQAARKGPGYYLYDSAPGSEGPRAFYVTGFSDNCPRLFTAALAIFGTPEFHEQLRYGLPAEAYPYSSTDRAYEKVKSRICNVGRNKPCGARIGRLKNTTVFISVYEHFEDNARWADMLLHDGALLASAVKTP